MKAVLGLLVLPALVVCLLVLVVLTFGWLTAGPGEIDSLVDRLARQGPGQWQAAVALAGALADPDNAAIKNDRQLAARLALILGQEIRFGSMQQGRTTLRAYLCRALGEFYVADGLPVLLEAASTHRDDRELEVRRAAIEALAVLAANIGAEQVAGAKDVLPVLLAASQDGRASVRSPAAFTLGVLGGEVANSRLRQMLGDTYPDVRYNAATGLARRGDIKAVDVLLEMLDPHQQAALEVEKQQPARRFKRTLILINGLRAVEQFAAANRQAVADRSADLRRLARAVERLCQAGVEPAVRSTAADVLEMLKRDESVGQDIKRQESTGQNTQSVPNGEPVTTAKDAPSSR